MMINGVRTRFAPSPTGFLHIGSARTALFSWLYAQKEQGTFILRIEDTDMERSTEASINAILEAMEWLNLSYQEGPFYQSKRFDRYREVLNQLLEDGLAYRCYCSKERLESLRAQQMQNKEKPRYDGFCRELQEEKAGPFVIRFKNPKEGSVAFNDLIRGTLTFSNEELDDLILARSDGVPTYNFTVVVDDWDMRITHVIRGDDHINNTPRQINILKALKADLPLYAHVPMILGSDGKRLSKRHGAMSVMEYREQGYLPEALLNYLARLGWSHGDQEIFSIKELINFFDLKAINRAPAAFNTDKLLWLNQHYIKNTDPEYLAEQLRYFMVKLGINTEQGPPLEDVILIQRERAKTLLEIAEKSRFFYEDITVESDQRQHIPSDIIPSLVVLRERLSSLAEWHKESIHDLLQSVAEEKGLKLGHLAQPLRVILTGGTVSPPIDSTILLLGKARVIARMDHFLQP